MTEQFFIIVAVITGLTEGVKRAGLNSRYAPLVSIALGMLCTVVFVGKEPAILLQGIIASLTASGLYSGVKTTVTKK